MALFQKIAAAFGGRKRRLAENAREAAELIHRELQATLGVSAPGPSRPGDPPHKHAGRVQASVSCVYDDASRAIVIRQGRVAGYLDHGTSKMPARPWREPTLARVRPKIAEILNRK